MPCQGGQLECNSFLKTHSDRGPQAQGSMASAFVQFGESPSSRRFTLQLPDFGIRVRPQMVQLNKVDTAAAALNKTPARKLQRT